MRIVHGDMREVLGKMVAEGKTVQAIVTDPPYHLTNITIDFAKDQHGTKRQRRAERGFMGKQWDGGDIAFQPGTWRLCWELLPPGGHMVAFAGTRTYHRMAVAIEEAGFEIRDTIAWLYGSGFPKSRNVSKAIDSEAGAEREVIGRRTDGRYATPMDVSGRSAGIMGKVVERLAPEITVPATDAARQWNGWGTALKPAMELICLARKPLDSTVAQTVLKHGTGALNIDGCRIASADENPSIGRRQGATNHLSDRPARETEAEGKMASRQSPEAFRAERPGEALGRWPANVCHDGSDEVVKAFPDANHKTGGSFQGIGYGSTAKAILEPSSYADSGSAARFFYSAKADAGDRLGSKHPTVKPVDLMRWLVRLITPPGGTVLDPFAGSGTTGMACMAESIDCILVEREAEYVADIKARLAHVRGDDTPLFKR